MTFMPWSPWLPCSTSCGLGKRTRHRTYITGKGSQIEHEHEDCNQYVACPSWSNWSNWDECSASCDGGIQSRSRQCQNGLQNDCSGSPTEEQQCSRDSCTDGFVYWKGYQASSGVSSNVLDSVMPTLPGQNYIDKCQRHCLSVPGCIAFEAWQDINWKNEIVQQCYTGQNSIDYSEDYYSLNEFVYPYMEYVGYPNVVVAMSKEFYENLEIQPDNPPDGAIVNGVIIDGQVNFDGYCDKVDTGSSFGQVNYRTFDKIKFVPFYPKNIITESTISTSQCAVKCFEKAGCTAFFMVDNDCSFIIGPASKREENNAVTGSGQLSPSVCPLTAFTTTYIKKSYMSYIFTTQIEAEDMADSIVEENTGNVNTPLRDWIFKTTNNYPMTKSSQYISVSIHSETNWMGNTYRKGSHTHRILIIM